MSCDFFAGCSSPPLRLPALFCAGLLTSLSSIICVAAARCALRLLFFSPLVWNATPSSPSSSATLLLCLASSLVSSGVDYSPPLSHRQSQSPAQASCVPFPWCVPWPVIMFKQSQQTVRILSILVSTSVCLCCQQEYGSDELSDFSQTQWW